MFLIGVFGKDPMTNEFPPAFKGHWDLVVLNVGRVSRPVPTVSNQDGTGVPSYVATPNYTVTVAVSDFTALRMFDARYSI